MNTKRIQHSYWIDETIMIELKAIISDIEDFPTIGYIQKIKKSSLRNAIGRNGGINKFRQLMGYKYILSPKGYWTNEKVLSELNSIISKIGKFPDNKYLQSTNRWDLIGGIRKNGGLHKYYILLGYKPNQNPVGYWTEERCIEELQKIILNVGDFPLIPQIKATSIHGLIDGISNNGGINKFRRLLGYPILCQSIGYWTQEQIVNEIKEIMVVSNKFPTSNYLAIINRLDLQHAITKNGGYRLFRTLIGVDIPHKVDGYWTKENTLKELQDIIRQIGHFPTQSDLITINRHDILGGIQKNGGIIPFMDLCGKPLSYLHELLSRRASYCSKRGKKSEDIVYDIMEIYCIKRGISLPIKNKTLSKSHRIEFVCNTNKTIGIDVINTKTKGNISRKWTKKEYHKHLDELWIVVFSDSFIKEDYIEWNNTSPDNVYIMNIDNFINELECDLDEATKNKIDSYKKCTFHSRLINDNNIIEA